jgi:hypothetical protein
METSSANDKQILSPDGINTIIENHLNTAIQHETAAKYHNEVAEYLKAGDRVKACESIIKARNIF